METFILLQFFKRTSQKFVLLVGQTSRLSNLSVSVSLYKSLQVSISLLLFETLLLAYGCGYRLSGVANPLPEDIRTIAIPFLKNETFEPGIENVFTNALREEFIKRGNLKIVEKDGADVILEGSVISFEIYPIAFSAVDNVMEHRAIVTILARLKREKDGRVIWENSKVVETTEYDVVLDLAVTDANERTALGRIAKEVSEDIYRQIFESKF